jgi:hypothetical protein
LLQDSIEYCKTCKFYEHWLAGKLHWLYNFLLYIVSTTSNDLCNPMIMDEAISDCPDKPLAAFSH